MWVLFLLAAWAAAFAACGRLCHAALTVTAAAAAAPPPAVAGQAATGRRLTLYETAFLSGGPHRLADLTLVSMSRDRRLLLAHTGWATVVDHRGRDDMERTVISAVGPGGQSPVPPVRSAVATADSVRTLADRLTAAGLAVPGEIRAHLAAAIRQLRGTAVLVPVTGLVALLLLEDGQSSGTVALWFALPLVLVLGALVIARYEVREYTRWASPAGLRQLPRAGTASGGTGTSTGTAAPVRDGRAELTALAVHGPAVLAEPELRAALGGGRAPLRPLWHR
ncbi:TIGR04222 domain-containing membrane protein [Streptomyces sp. N2-109]|uniref:TIGR04222 domain-containing membrane protein n=1 Tax=Streptomyces gossypii TaxID=2883101 RepID=A0ABT2JSI8_9ACTN|nr:TIGR04222 domain-containing membrane protein [Streptomyces gossypii]MCT2590849.1 TIGR04222 domain-containing membrane protein [Streptomyces gossypii]